MGAQAVRLSNIDIDNALKNKDFEVLFQPIFDLGNGALARVESFVRWRHATLGVLPPGAFISFFESQGRMGELTRYVLEQALQSYQAWRGANPPGFSINLALSDLSDDAFASHFDVLLRDSGFPADLITLECPMPPVTTEPAQAAEQFRRLARTGARLAIEVRGRANDFLRQIEPLPFDEIKTGGAAILRFARTVRGPGLSAISELLDIAQKSNAAITAVGVEDQASLAALRSLGFAAAQGNHLAKVGPLSNFRTERVNEVRALLGLAPLDEAELDALFRVSAPDVSAAALDAKKAGRPAKKSAAATAPEGEAARAEDEEKTAANETVSQPVKPSRAARTRARSAPVRAADPEATKAAAIARIKRKAAAAAASAGEADGQEDDAPAPAAARSLQEWLSREFHSDALDELDDGFDLGEPPTGSDGQPSASRSKADAEEAPLATQAEPADARGGREQEEEAGRRREPSASDASDTTFAPARPPEESESDAQRPETAKAAQDASVADDQPDASDAFELEEIEPVLIDAPPPMKSAPPDPESVRRAALAIAGARAYFRPGIRVGVLGAAPASDQPAPPDKSETAEFETPESDAPEPFAAAHGGAREAEASAPAEPVAPARPAAPRRRRRKNFLTRKYRLWPTHFWPKSWKRAWRRRQARRAAE
ncbi:EAL domain-containing protein [Amphiplicatus metriothermophilus]|uniref:EAL domain, c-di-GMP-specific phosphodiesterase class I (Or its enzymatically inactive variant) n=1 Tax=Amphiplicatus metriothermophilus TaxID=1519374 RepID=A0A239PR69_9PROT|nr:EAL domain-containing protein [Amphiplicatus metriothermophilus]MBB5518416.1 EAL domain-containing protein (putative c-di-GMP-specific phosphodiesterase class I) [Amphiplicatus metriothermophilus]SNT72422.1 EAL domain, c-di-GMP-specific phosphodiesterase class I (or its enzymatically inactive variant) [Amphiplicatus metriothermophilus]